MRIKLSEYISKNPTITVIAGKKFLIDKNIDHFILEISEFKDCDFELNESGTARFEKCTISDCSFKGSKAKTLTFQHCPNISNIELTGHFSQVTFTSCTLKGLVDNSNSPLLQFQRTTVIDSQIGGKCSKLVLFESNFKSTKLNKASWNKQVDVQVQCTNSTFNKIKLNPYYLATKCDDKSSLDLSGAMLIDDWSRLRKKYAGINLIIVFLLTLIFFLPLITKSFVLLLAAKIDPDLMSFERVQLWEAILFDGKEETFSRISYIVLTFVLLLYNIGRLWLTISIAKLKEEEQFLNDSNFQLVSIHPEKLKNQLFVDRILNWMLVISIAYSAMKLVDTLMIQVPIF